jgi:GxxExxY protein
MAYTRSDDPETYDVIGAAMAVHSELGCGYLEVVYRAALKSEFRRRGISYENEVSLPIHYKGELLPFNYRVDFKCGSALVEAKALEALSSVHLSQVINYLKASGLQRGLLINFGTRHLEYKRVIWSQG